LAPVVGRAAARFKAASRSSQAPSGRMSRRQKSVAVQSNIDGLLLEKAVEFFGEECEKRWGELAASVKSPRSVGRAFKRLAEDLEFVERQAQGEDASSAKTKVRKVARLSALMEERVASLQEEYEAQLEELRAQNAELRRALEEAAQDAANAQEASARQVSEVRARNAALSEQLSRWCAGGSEVAPAIGKGTALESTSATAPCGVASTDSSIEGEGPSGQALTMETKMRLLQHAHATKLSELQSQNAQLSERLETKDLLISKKDQLLARMRPEASTHESASTTSVQQSDGEPIAHDAANATPMIAHLSQDLGGSSFVIGSTNEEARSAFSARAGQSHGRPSHSLSTSACAVSTQDTSTSFDVGSTHEPTCTDSPRVEPSKGIEAHFPAAIANSEFAQHWYRVGSTSSATGEEGLPSSNAAMSEQCRRQPTGSQTKRAVEVCAKPKHDVGTSCLMLASSDQQASTDQARVETSKREEPQAESVIASSEFVQPVRKVSITSAARVAEGSWNQSAAVLGQGAASTSRCAEDGCAHPSEKHAPVLPSQSASPSALCAQLKLWTPAHCESRQAQQAQALEMMDVLQTKLLEMSTFLQNSRAQAQGAAPPMLAPGRVSPRDDEETSPLPAFSTGRQDPEGESLPKNSEVGTLCKPERSVHERGQAAGKGRPPRPSLMLTPLASGCSAREAAVRSSQRGRSFDRCFASDIDCEDISTCSTRSGVSSVDGASSGSEGGCSYSASRHLRKVGSTPPLLPPLEPRPAQDGRGSREFQDDVRDFEAASAQAQIKRKLSWVQGWQPELPSSASVRQRSAGPDLEQRCADEKPLPLRCPPASARSSSARVLVRIVSEAGIRCHGDDLKLPRAPDSRGGQNISS